MCNWADDNDVAVILQLHTTIPLHTRQLTDIWGIIYYSISFSLGYDLLVPLFGKEV